MNKREWILKAFKGERVGRVPIGFWHHFLENDLMAAGMKDPELIRKNLEGHARFRDEFDPDFVKMMTDGLFYRPDDSYPEIREASDLWKLKPLDAHHPYIEACIRQARAVREIFGPEEVIFYNLPSPVHHLQKHLYGTSTFKKYPAYLAEDPEASLAAIDALTQDAILLVRRVMMEAQMDGIYFGLHNDNVFTREQYDSYLKPSELAVLAEANRFSEVNIAHICGYRGRVNNFDVYRDYPVTVFNWAIHSTDLTIRQGKEFFTHCKCVIGGFDQTIGSLIHAGSRADIMEYTWKLLEENGNEGFIIGADCTIPNDTPVRNMLAVKQARDYWATGQPLPRKITF